MCYGHPLTYSDEFQVLLGGPKKIVCIDVNVGIVTVLNDTRQSQDILQPVEFRMKTSLVQTSSVSLKSLETLSGFDVAKLIDFLLYVLC